MLTLSVCGGTSRQRGRVTMRELQHLECQGLDNLSCMSLAMVVPGCPRQGLGAA